MPYIRTVLHQMLRNWFPQKNKKSKLQSIVYELHSSAEASHKTIIYTSEENSWSDHFVIEALKQELAICKTFVQAKLNLLPLKNTLYDSEQHAVFLTNHLQWAHEQSQVAKIEADKFRYYMKNDVRSWEAVTCLWKDWPLCSSRCCTAGAFCKMHSKWSKSGWLCTWSQSIEGTCLKW